MTGLDFEWDKSKARDNLGKHGVTFEFATRVFMDPLAVEFIDDREDYGEERLILTGAIEGNVLYVVHTERSENRIRIISARRATKDEKDFYYAQSGQAAPDEGSTG